MKRDSQVEKAWLFLSKLNEANEMYKQFNLDEELVVSFGKDCVEVIDSKCVSRGTNSKDE